ncbi:MAG TPA: Fe-S cluster assembly protein SufD [Actinobacteria bacterium]|nr:Fe-S cluster assembly protein SufD [Actinomycetota bacterium]
MFDRSIVERRLELDPGWRRRRRLAAFERFSQLEPPSEREELWRYVELDFSLGDFELPEGPGRPIETDAVAAALAPVASIRVVDGFGADARAEVEGLVVGALAAHDGTTPSPERAVERAGIEPDDHFAAAHEAFTVDGAFIHAARGTRVPGPVYVDVQLTGSGIAAFPAVVLHAEPSTELPVVVHLRSPDGEYGFAAPHVVVLAEDGAVVSLTILQEWGSEVRAVGRVRFAADRDAVVRFTEVGLGGRYARVRLDGDLVGPGAEADVVGAYFGENHQVLDYRYHMRHAAPHTRSDMFLKGAVEDEASSVFTGLIRIEEEGQKTEAFQTNRNLILSKGASAQSVPNLEILANDVKCGHGSTVGPLDEEQRYYLMSRGLSAAQADRLQIRGFFEEAIARMPHHALAPIVRERLNRKFVEAQEEGRL